MSQYNRGEIKTQDSFFPLGQLKIDFLPQKCLIHLPVKFRVFPAANTSQLRDWGHFGPKNCW